MKKFIQARALGTFFCSMIPLPNLDLGIRSQLSLWRAVVGKQTGISGGDSMESSKRASWGLTKSIYQVISRASARRYSENGHGYREHSVGK